MDYASTINTVVTVNVTMAKLLRPVRRNAQSDVAMVCVVLWNTVIIVLATADHVILNLRVAMVRAMAMKIVQHVLMIVARVNPPNIVETISVTMEKRVIHVGLIAQNVPKSVEMVSVQVQKTA